LHDDPAPHPRSGKPDKAATPRRFPRSRRLTKATEFSEVFAARLRRSNGPITLHARPNGLDRPRLGLSIGRRVGAAVRRNRLKRHLREAFRLTMDNLPHGRDGFYDYIISARAHEEASLSWYIQTLTTLAHDLHRTSMRRDARVITREARQTTADGDKPAPSDGPSPNPSSG